MSKRTYLDANLLIAAWQVKDDSGAQALAIAAQADEFVSAEKPRKPMFRVREIPMRSVRDVTA